MPESNFSSGIDRDEAVLLASRLFAAFLLFWVVEDITELPRELFSFIHYLHESTRSGLTVVQALRSIYLVSDYMMYLLGNILRIAMWLLAAGWFYRCGPRIRTFFAANSR